MSWSSSKNVENGDAASAIQSAVRDAKKNVEGHQQATECRDVIDAQGEALKELVGSTERGVKGVALYGHIDQNTGEATVKINF